ASNYTFLSGFGSVYGAYGCHVANGLVYVAEYYASRVQVYSTAGQFLFSFGGPGSGPGQFNAAEATEIDPQGNLYVADTGNDRVQKFTSSGAYLGEFAVPPSNESERRPIPDDLAISSDGYLYVVGYGSARIYKYALPGREHTPDCSGVTASIEREWPLNNKLVPVAISGVTDPDGVAVRIR